MVEPTTRDRGDPVDADHGSAVEGSAEGVPEQGHMPPLAELVRGARSVEGHLARGPRRAEREATAQPRSGPPRRILHGCEKRGEAVGLTKRGKGTKLVVLVSGEGVLLGVQVAAASASEASLAIPTLEELNDVVVDGGIAKPRFVVADKGYDSDPLRDAFAARGVTLLSPHRRNRKRPTTPRRAPHETLPPTLGRRTNLRVVPQLQAPRHEVRPHASRLPCLCACGLRRPRTQAFMRPLLASSAIHPASKVTGCAPCHPIGRCHVR